MSLGLDGIRIVPASDPKVDEIRSSIPGVDTLISSFRGEHCQPHLPSVLIVRRDYEEAISRDISAIVAFRNAVAMSFVLPSRASFVADTGWPTVSWADFFDFHPTSVARDGSLYTDSPAFRALLIPPEDFQAMPSTALNTGTRLGAHDPYLARNLGRLWHERFIRPRRNDLLGRLVFRSLEVAFHAASQLNRNGASLNDYGLQVALWVTALEVLARPRSGNASQHKVLALLRQSRWDDKRLAGRRYTLRFQQRGGKWKYERGSISEKLCNNLYQARHKFVHGAGVDIDAMTPKVGAERPALPRVAALVYRAALIAKLRERFKRKEWSLSPDIFAENLAGFEQEQALRKVMGLD